MSGLHKLVYQMVSNPTVMNDVAQNPSLIARKFDLSPSEIRVLSTFSNNGQLALQPLLSQQTLQRATANLMESLWIPPGWP